jgi:hypothetical protein
VPKCPPTSLYLRVFQQQSWGYKPTNMGLLWDLYGIYDTYIYMGIIPQFEQNRDLLTNKQWDILVIELTTISGGSHS